MDLSALLTRRRLLAGIVLLLNTATFAQPSGTNLWTLPVGGHNDSSPALSEDGTLYFGGWDNRFYAASTNGYLKWNFRTGSEIKSSPAIADDGTVYFGCRDKKFYALTPDGKLKWSFTTGAWVDSSPAIGRDGTIYFGGWDKNFYALNPDGTKKWVFTTRGEIDSSPAIALDGTIYFGSHDKNFYALNPDGTRKWAFATGDSIISSPAIDFEGRIYFSSVDGKFYVLNPDGTPHWSVHTGGVSASSPVISADGTVYVGVNTNYAAITSAGKLKWQFPTWLMVDSTAALAETNIIYFGSRDSVLSVFLPDAISHRAIGPERIWSVWIKATIIASPVIGPDGTVYVLSGGGTLNAIYATKPLMNSSWPMFRGNPRHTGRAKTLPANL